MCALLGIDFYDYFAKKCKTILFAVSAFEESIRLMGAIHIYVFISLFLGRICPVCELAYFCQVVSRHSAR